MILPKFVAIRAYLESIGIAFGQKDMIDPLLEALLKETELSTERGREILNHNTDTATSVFRLFEHIGILSKRIDKDEKITYYFYSNIGKEVLKDRRKDENLIQPLTPFFLSWLPFKLFLKYLQVYPNSTTEDINSNLGKQVAHHTKDFVKFIPLKNVNEKDGVTKPFNKFVISNSLAEIGKFLELIIAEKKDGPFYLTPLGKYVANSIDPYNFNFHKLEININYGKLAILDFISTQPKGMVLISNKEQLKELKSFIEIINDKKYLKQSLKIETKIKDFDAILTKDNAYWTCSNSLFNLSYDPIKVLELNANIVNIV